MSVSGVLLMRALLPVILALAFAVLPMHAQAQWKWRDAQGRVTVSDRPPPQDVPAQNILSRPAGADRKDRAAPAPAARASDAATTPVVAAAPGVDPEIEARKKKLEQEQLAKQKEAEDRRAAEMRDNCQRARAHMASLESGARIARPNDKGEREILDDDQRAAEMARTREAIAANCK
jgi:hypothetical protein